MANHREWTCETYSTHALYYTVCHKQQPSQRTRPCTLVAVTVNDFFNYDIPCLHCDNKAIECEQSLSEYLHFHTKRKFLTRLSWNLPDIKRCCAKVIAYTLRTILEEAHNKHQQPVAHVVQIRTTERTADEEEEEEEHTTDEEEVRPCMMPASDESVQQLLARKRKRENEEGEGYENGWIGSDHTCVICMDEIETKKRSLDMLCNHVFHEECLVKWLETNNICPLCRYTMPVKPLLPVVEKID